MIYIDNRQNKIEFDTKAENVIRDVIEYTLRKESVDIGYEISMILIDNHEIKKLNLEMRKIEKVTDVLSFPMLEYPKGKVYKDIYINYNFQDDYLNDKDLVLGDIALSLERALEQSAEYGHSFTRECAYLTVHSVLHLLGYDHIQEQDKILMRRREEEILSDFKIRR
jgi:probable rRNA maturation factor